MDEQDSLGEGFKVEEPLEVYFEKHQQPFGKIRLMFGTVEEQESEYRIFCSKLTPVQRLQYATMLIEAAFADQPKNINLTKRITFDKR